MSDTRLLQRLVRRLSAWAWREELRLHQNVAEDAQSLVDALLHGERADAYCGYGRDGQASNYRDELKDSLRELRALKPNNNLSNAPTTPPALAGTPCSAADQHDRNL